MFDSQVFIDPWDDPVTYAIPFFILFMVVELISLKYLDNEPDEFGSPERMGYEGKDTATNLLLGVGSVAINFFARAAAFVLYLALYAITPLRMSPKDWWTWVIAFLLIDFLWYSYHRASHRIRILWAMHQAHHSSVYFNYAVALRQKWNPWGELLFWIPVPLLGIPPWMIFFVWSCNLIYQFWVHTETIPKLWAPFEFIFNTPSHHRVHHASDREYLDRNYGGILIIWDRLFGSYAEETRRPVYGLTKPVGTFNPLRLQYGEFGEAISDVRRAASWRERAGYLFGPPGWQPPTDEANEPETVSA
jgi:sterol desaturase/sphingolipid hydroxylase (fatty acid hydroxylase superfamily)